MPEENWEKEIDKVTEKFINSFGMLTESQLNYKPCPMVGSIATNDSSIFLEIMAYLEKIAATVCRPDF